MFCIAGGSGSSEERTLKATNGFNVSCVSHSGSGVLHIQGHGKLKIFQYYSLSFSVKMLNLFF